MTCCHKCWFYGRCTICQACSYSICFQKPGFASPDPPWHLHFYYCLGAGQEVQADQSRIRSRPEGTPSTVSSVDIWRPDVDQSEKTLRTAVASSSLDLVTVRTEDDHHTVDKWSTTDYYFNPEATPTDEIGGNYQEKSILRFRLDLHQTFIG